MDDINKIYQLLDWNNDESTQLKGIEYAVKMNNIDCFIQPITEMYNKNIWDNCAKILSRKADNELKDYLQYLLEWIQDLNWPGAFIILERINAFKDKEIVQNAKDKCRHIADENDDRVWLENLDMIH